jgi:phosphoribosylformylglycinamidine synthase
MQVLLHVWRLAESITNIASAKIAQLSDIKLSANWMAAAGYGTEDQNLFNAVKADGYGVMSCLGDCYSCG